MAPPSLLFPVAHITGLAHGDEGENILVRHLDAKSVPNVGVSPGPCISAANPTVTFHSLRRWFIDFYGLL